MAEDDALADPSFIRSNIAESTGIELSINVVADGFGWTLFRPR
jgi:hypothetical protein